MNDGRGTDTPRLTSIPTAAMAELCHVVRTPLNGVLGSLELLLECNLAEEQLALARSAFDAAMALHLLFEDELDLTRDDA